MDTTTPLYIGLAVIVVGVLVYQVVTSNSRRNKRFLSSIINSWGNLPKREYDYGELEHIAKYFQATKKEEFTIDDITWNDLDMDSVLYDESVPQQQRRRLSLQAAAYTADKQEGA